MARADDPLPPGPAIEVVVDVAMRQKVEAGRAEPRRASQPLQINDLAAEDGEKLRKLPPNFN